MSIFSLNNCHEITRFYTIKKDANRLFHKTVITTHFYVKNTIIILHNKKKRLFYTCDREAVADF